jgi:magnesium-transporting ATPase (P-type)
MLADSSHRVSHDLLRILACYLRHQKCIMITGDNPLTAVHVARDVEIVDREVLILDLKEYPRNEAGRSIQLLTPISS